jgi:hypothetical protein
MSMRYLRLTLIIGALALTTPCAGEAHGRAGMSHGGGHGSPHVVDVPRHFSVHVPLRVPHAGTPLVTSPVRPFTARVPRGVGPFGAGLVDPFPESADIPFAVSPPLTDIAIPEVPAPSELPATRQAAPPVRRAVPVADSKIVFPPPPMPPGPPCSHTVVIYRGSQAEVQSFPISPCPAAKRPG